MLLAASALVAGLGAAPREVPPFLLDGRPIAPFFVPLHDTEGPVQGDVVGIGGFLVTLRGQKPYSFWTPKEGDGLLLERGGSREWVAVSMAAGEDGKVEAFDRLSDRERRGLWGVMVADWNPGVAARLQETDLPQLCVWLPMWIPEGLPAGLGCLSAVVGVRQDLAYLRPLRSLRFLSIDGFATAPHGVLDLGDVAFNSGLIGLEVRTPKVVGLEALALLGELRGLTLQADVGDLSFLRGLKRLRALDVSKTPVRDLSPLAALPEIVRVDANQSAVETLPAMPVASLREIRLLSTRLSDDALAAFRRSNPRCRVADRWQGLLTQALDGATRIRIRKRPGSPDPEDKAPPEPEETDPAVVRRVAASLRVEEPRSSPGQHACAGGERLDFYQADRLAATLSLDHGYFLRWSEWPADVPADGGDLDYVADWLAGRGFPATQRELAAHRASAAYAARRRERTLGDLPPALRGAFGDDGFEGALARAEPDPASQVRLLLRILGANNDVHALEQRAGDLLARQPEAQARAAAREALLGADRRARRGAARLWLQRPSPLADWHPDDVGRLRGAALDVLEESRVPNDREEAVARIEEWAADLPAEEVARRIQGLLHDPHEGVRVRAGGAAARLGVRSAIPDLLAMLEGRTIEVRALSAAPREETEDVDESVGSFYPPEVVAAEAAVALAQLEVQQVRPILEERQERSSRYVIALALLGEGQRLRRELFQEYLGENGLLGAVEAVARARGAYGLDFALEPSYAAHSAGVEGRWAVRLHRMLREQRAPGAETLPAKPTLDDLRAWYARFGEEYVRRVRAGR